MENDKWDLVKIKESKYGILYSGPDGETFFHPHKEVEKQDSINQKDNHLGI